MSVNGKAGAAGVFVGKKYAVPVLAAIGGPKHAAILLRARGAPERARVYDLRIRGIYDNAPNAPGFVETHVRPRLAGIQGLVHAVAHHVDIANRPSLAGTRPDDIRRGWRHGERADGLYRLVIEDRRPVIASIGRLPHAAGRSAGVVCAWVASDARDGRDAIAYDGPDPAKSESFLLSKSTAPLRKGRSRAHGDT